MFGEAASPHPRVTDVLVPRLPSAAALRYQEAETGENRRRGKAVRVISDIGRPAVLQGGTCEKGSEAGVGWRIQKALLGVLLVKVVCRGQSFWPHQMLGL